MHTKPKAKSQGSDVQGEPITDHFCYATQLSAAFAMRMSVRLSFCRESRLSNMLCTVPQNDVSSFLRPNFALLNLWIHL